MRFELEKGSTRAAVSSLGGELVSLVDGSGAESIWCGDPAYWSGVNPLLFPVVGNTKGGIIFDGGTYAMPMHGFARRKEFSVAERGGDFVIFELRETPDTLRVYPFPFTLLVRHQLLEGGFTTTVTVKNTGGTPLPFCLGAHTAFRCPVHEGESFEDYEMVFDKAETAHTLCLTGNGFIRFGGGEPWLDGEKSFPLRYADFDRLDTLIFRDLASTGVSLRHRETGHGVHVDFAGFPMLGMWSPPGKRAPFVCIEPWHGCAALEDESGVFQEKPFCITLQPGGEKALSYTVRVL